MNKLLKLLKYLKYVDVLVEVGRALELGKNGENFKVESDLRVEKKQKTIRVEMVDRVEA